MATTPSNPTGATPDMAAIMKAIQGQSTATPGQAVQQAATPTFEDIARMEEQRRRQMLAAKQAGGQTIGMPAPPVAGLQTFGRFGVTPPKQQ